ncbi:MAG: PrgI family protein [Patescibacteria group bacterium]|nr:PrgI family protein [Patescibacteria group bacterium]
MNQFIVPQFIDAENKILGPLSVRQFLILLVTGGLIYVWYELFSFFIFAIAGVLTLAIGGTFAFVKINSQMFHIFILLMIQTLRRPNLKIWKREAYKKPSIPKDKKKKDDETIIRPKEEVTSSRLSELSLMVDTGGAFEAEKSSQKLDPAMAGNKKPPITN